MTLQTTQTLSNTLYRINDVVDFDPVKLSLMHRVNGVEITLFAPASRCLLLLIENQNSIIKQQKLMQKGWEAYGLNVSPNTYYQNIAHIRKAFSELLPDQEILTTVKRVGIIISNEVNIRIVHIDQENPVQEVPETIISVGNEQSPVHRKKSRLILILIFLFSISILIASIVFYLYHIKKNAEFFESYTYYKKTTAGCDVFVNKDGGAKLTSVDSDKIDSLECDPSDRVYVTRWPLWPRSSILQCSSHRFYTGGLSCITYFYVNLE